MAKRRKRRSTRTRKAAETPGWVWGAFGLAVGLSVAAAVWVSDRRGAPATVAVPEPAPASVASSLDDNGETRREGVVRVEPEVGDDGEQRFTFYELLKRSEVLIPEEPETASVREPVAVVEPGTYVLQAGSFSTEADADRRRAELAMHGIESRIQKASIDGRIYYRVRIGPTDDLDRLNLLRSRLRAAQIDAVRLREIE